MAAPRKAKQSARSRARRKPLSSAKTDVARLKRQLAEAHAQQVATAEILRVISGSPTDTQPVFETILRNAARLCDSKLSAIFRFDGKLVHLAATHNWSAAALAEVASKYPMAPDRSMMSGRTILAKRVVREADTYADPEYNRTSASAGGWRRMLGVPMLRDGEPIGAFVLAWPEPGETPEHHVELLKTFADQAVIAIENARRFSETKEALERQTATGEILASMSNSMTEAQPVFDAIARNVVRLLGTRFSVVQLVRDKQLHLASFVGPGFEKLKEYFPLPLSGESTATQGIRARKVVQLVPIVGNPKASKRSQQLARTFGYNSIVTVPMLRNGNAIGAINTSHREAIPFDDKQVALLKAFADQAVIAIENVRLFNETNEALERQTATAEILKVISSSPTDTQPVFDAIARNANILCNGLFTNVFRFDGELVHWVASANYAPRAVDILRKTYPARPNVTQVSGRVILGNAIVRLEDALADPEYDHRFADAGGWRRILGVPMLREGNPIGAIVVGWSEPGPVQQRHEDLLMTFADQAVIAIENVRLFNETKEALERQTATSGILQVMSGSPTDVQPVFDAIVKSGARLFSGAGFAIALPDAGQVRLASIADEDPERCARWKASYPFPLTRDYMHATAILDRRAIDVPDALDPPAEWLAGIQNFIRTGYRAITITPMVRGDTAIGTVSVVRVAPGPLTDKQIAILKTFADQAVIAIENVRLFNETKEALEQQTATAEILRVISSSPTNVQPVFDAIVQSGLRIFAGTSIGISIADGDSQLVVASGGNVAQIPSGIRVPRSRESATGMAVVERTVVNIRDTEAPDVPPSARDNGRALGFRAIAAVPLLREAEAIGAISLLQKAPGGLSDKQVALLKSFADQAVIAIENVRLFNETKEALERQTATAEILQVIGSSPTDTQPVFDAIVNSGVRLFPGAMITVARPDGGNVRAAAIAHADSTMVAGWRERFATPLSRDRLHAAAILDAKLIDLPDAEAEKDGPLGPGVRNFLLSGNRAVTIMPMLRGEAAIGAISVTRAVPGPLSDKQIAILRTFANQAVIAIENVRLFKELESRTEALTRSVGQLTALGEVGRAISSTLDLETVLQTIVARAVQLTEMDGGAIYEYDERTEEFHLRATRSVDADYLAVLRGTTIRKGEGAVGRSALTGEPVQIPDVLDGSYKTRLREALIRAGYRAVLVVPLRREEHIIGALSVTRKSSGAFAPEIVELLKTFATQSAMAIQNARLFREIEEKGKQLEEASRHKSQFLASMSHELRTPLNAILGFNEMIIGQVYGEVPTDMQEPLNDIQTSGKHLLRLINNVLDLAKIEAGRMELALSDYSVQDTVESVRSTLRPLAADKGLEFLAGVPNDIPLAHGDGGRIAQCLMNLAGNSLKFTKAGKVEISVALSDGMLRYCVADTGIGIPPDKIGSLFTEFKQTDATIASEYGGTGLGLSISRKFVEMHGGRIWVESEIGKGSAFIFEIPLRVTS